MLESPALPAFLPAICPRAPRRAAGAAVGERPGGAAMRRARRWLAHASTELVIKPVGDATRRRDSCSAGISTRRSATRGSTRLRSRPERYVLEEYLPLAHVPVWSEHGLESRALMMRVFLAADGHGDYRVLPGGLSRIGGTDREVVSGQRGGGSKDTWVLSDAPVERFSLLPGRLARRTSPRSERAVSSRAAEHLFWMGRYAERSENAARLLRAVLSRLPQRRRQRLGRARRRSSPPAAASSCCRPSADVAGESAQRVRADADRRHHARATARTASRSTSRETLRVGRHGSRSPVVGQLADPQSPGRDARSRRSRRAVTLADALELLDHAIISLVAVGGLEMAHMTRDDGWRFMSLGRHLERAALRRRRRRRRWRSRTMAEDPALLEWLLDLSDSIITYRARYMGHAEWIAVADLLLFDRPQPAIGGVPAREARQARPAAAGRRSRRRSARGSRGLARDAGVARRAVGASSATSEAATRSRCSCRTS